MNGEPRPVPGLRDERLPAFRTMISPAASEMLAAATGDPALRATARQVQWLPGRSLTVVYETNAGTGTGGHLVAMTGDGLPPGALLLQREEERIAVWRLADDPALPGLAVALDAERLGRVLDDLGVAPGPMSTRLRSYRPGRRAVVEVQRGRHRLFVKVVRPAQAAALQARHAMLAETMPVPRSHGWSAEHGLVVLQALSGGTLRERLDTAGAPLPGAASIEAMLDLLPVIEPHQGREEAGLRPGSAGANPGPGVKTPGMTAGAYTKGGVRVSGPSVPGVETPGMLGGQVVVGPLVTVGQHAALLRRILPELAERLDAFEAGLGDSGDTGPAAMVHGDLHDAQLMVRDGRLSGVLDVDTVAMGYRVDDWAGIIGHLSARMQGASGPVRGRLAAYGASLLALAESRCDRRALRVRVGAVVLGLATGPFRVQTTGWVSETRERFGLAEEWLAGASPSTKKAADEKTLTPVSGMAHPELRS